MECQDGMVRTMKACMKDVAWERANGVKCGVADWVKRSSDYTERMKNEVYEKV